MLLGLDRGERAVLPARGFDRRAASAAHELPGVALIVLCGSSLAGSPGTGSAVVLALQRNAKTFLEEGDKVKITLRFRGREMAHQEVAYKVMNRVKQVLEPVGKVESEPSFEGRQMIMILAEK